MRTYVRSKAPDAFLEPILNFVSQFMRPLVEKIDAVHYTELSRMLKEGEEYAIRLLQPNYTEDRARDIAERLTSGYPSHDFVIGYEEASTFLDLAKENDEQRALLDRLSSILRLGDDVMIGTLVDVREKEADGQRPDESGDTGREHRTR